MLIKTLNSKVFWLVYELRVQLAASPIKVRGRNNLHLSFFLVVNNQGLHR